MNLRYVLVLLKVVVNAVFNLYSKKMKKFLLNWIEAGFQDSLGLQLVELDTFVWFIAWEGLDNYMAMSLEESLVPYLILLIQHNLYQYSYAASNAALESF